MAKRSAKRAPASLVKAPPGSAIVVLLRHGETAFNKEPSRMRGWLDVPLNDKGVQQAQEAAKEVSSAHQISDIYTSDLQRSTAVAHHVCEVTGAKIHPAPWARTWNLGTLQGQLVDSIVPHLKQLTTTNRDVAPPGGESFNQFLTRWLSGLETVIAHAPRDGRAVAVVSHIQNLMTAKQWAVAGAPHDMKRLRYAYSNDNEVDPGSYFAIISTVDGKISTSGVTNPGPLRGLDSL